MNISKDIFKSMKQDSKSVLMGIILFVLFGTIAIETVMLLVQEDVHRKIEAQSEQALGRFLKQGHPLSAIGRTILLLKNVRFCWSEKVCVNTERMTAGVIPVSGQEVNFDDINRFIVNVQNADVLISPTTMEGMFNESIFNYPGSKLRNLRVEIIQAGRQNHIKLSGSLKYLLWIPFEMDTDMHVDHKTNTLVISVNTLHVFGFIPATWMIELKPFRLEKLLTLPPNRYLTIHQNVMMVKPFGLFPPPRIDGQMSGIEVTPNMIMLHFRGNDMGFPKLPIPGAQNYIYLVGGTTQFGPFKMLGTQVQVIDQNPGNLFRFSLMNYWHYVLLSRMQIQQNNAMVLWMPDHGSLAKYKRQPKT